MQYMKYYRPGYCKTQESLKSGEPYMCRLALRLDPLASENILLCSARSRYVLYYYIPPYMPTRPTYI